MEPKESAIGVQDISQMTKPEAIAAIHDKLDRQALTPREAIAIQLIDRMVADAHTVDDAFFDELRQHFTEDELIELVFAGSLFIWGNHFNVTMRVDTDAESAYPKNLSYAEPAGD